jgi:hypothetical protein
LGKHPWIVGALGLSLGLAIGSSGTYLWFTHASPIKPGEEFRGEGGRPARPALAPDNGRGNGEATLTDPTEEDARAAFQAMLTRAGVDAEILKFRRTDWSYVPEQKYYGVAFEVELAFRANYQLKETMALMWSPENLAEGWGGAMRVTALETFKKGDRKNARGHLGYQLQDGRWKLSSLSRIDSAK